MIWILLVLAFMFSWHLLNAFSVSVPKEKYRTHYGSNVTMECTFPVGEKLDLSALTVYWDKEGKFLVKFVDGKEDLKIRKSNSRLRHLNDQLYKGKSLLHITNVTVKDAGAYRCIIGYGGADYKWITLTVNAPYNKINQRIKMDPVTSEYEITCQSEGYPKAEVIWKSRDQDLSNKATVTYSVGPEKLFNVTSTLRVNATVNESFQCLFQEKDTGKNISAQIVIPENYAATKIDSRTYFGTLGAVFFVGLILMLLCFRKKHVRMIAKEKNYLST
ncbi:programmed cell death 1 ligand 1 isoform X1 [Antechinus flavipes]|uniref:programmed cell death 1 ligand 1 isoform X1 n=1 Tax=Antechinus flavipes TaxID=38775 RepID=UPI0022364D1A|nr:programmed cell death 1 ligand 1 isoform X1 [Antechinus flavipes]